MTERRDDHDPTSFEVDRHIDDQPPREDLIDTDELASLSQTQRERGVAVDEDDTAGSGDDAPVWATSEDQPESQGMDAGVAPRGTEDDGRCHPLSDEEGS